MSKKTYCVVTIDGPSGAGKGTITRKLSNLLGYDVLDSGAMYRVVALAAEKDNADFDNEEALSEVVQKMDVKFSQPQNNNDDIKVILDGEDVTDKLRLESTGNNASKVASKKKVRDALLHKQREFKGEKGLVADGRDMGTVVFPKALVKIYLTASPEVRAQRRYKQLIEKGVDANIADLAREIAQRDERDMNRSESPLKPADDAVVVDSSDLDIDQVVETILKHVKNKLED